MSIYKQMIEAGVEISNHSSDLYVPVNDVTRAIVADYEFANNVTTFRSNVDGKQWYDIPFAFEPYWDLRRGIT